MLKRKIIILGSGPAGLSAAIYGARAGLNPLVIDGPSPGGQLMTTTAVENWAGDTSVQGPALMKRMREHATHYGTEFLSETVTQVNLSGYPFICITDRKTEIHTNALIIATGATSKRLNCPGESDYWGKGVTTCAICDGALYKDLPVVIVGGGDSAMESASFMTNFTNDITIVHIMSELTASHAMQKRVLDNPSIKIIYSSTVTRINGNGKQIESVSIKNQESGEECTLPTRGLFINIGLKPNTDLFTNQLEMDDYGYILLKRHTETSVRGVFAAGDVADSRYRQAITSAGTGCAALLDAEKHLKEELLG